LLYYAAPKAWRNVILIVVSCLFYAWDGTGHLALLLVSVIVNYFIGRGITNSISKSKSWLVVGICFNVALLLYFKYRNFFISSFVGDDYLTKLVLPIGISFYTFHQLSMLRDVYRDRTLPKLTFGNAMLYVTYFPQLVAGPIVRYKDIIFQIQDRKETIDKVYWGLRRFIIGLGKKVLIANNCALIANAVFDNDIVNQSSGAMWVGTLAYTLQIFFDFSGYSDMAVGLGSLFGFRLPENFNQPYISKSIKEIWTRWHISLSTWFRDYVYIPLGGSKGSPIRTYFNLYLVFLLTGFWHGASWSFIFWGAFNGLFLVIERLGFDLVLQKIPKVFSWFYAMIIFMIGLVFVRIELIHDAFSFINKLFVWDWEGKQAIHLLNQSTIFWMLLGVILSLTKKPILFTKENETLKMEILTNGLLLLVLLLSVMQLVHSSFNPFIYFNF